MSQAVEIFERTLFPGIVADEIIASIQDALSDQPACSLVLAGGSTPGASYRLLGRPPRIASVAWSKVRLYWSDERWVPANDDQNNLHMARETFLNALLSSEGKIKPPQFFPVDTSLASPQDGARKYSETIRKAEGLSADQLPSFDLVILGVGSDGHTASIFPSSIDNPQQGYQTGEIAAVADRSPDQLVRITLTPDVLLNSRRILVLVQGENKADVCRAVLEGSKSEQELPARMLLRAKGRVTWFLDSAAASKLQRRSS